MYSYFVTTDKMIQALTFQRQREKWPGARGTTGAKVSFCHGTVLPTSGIS